MDNKAELLRLLRLAWAADHVSAADCKKIDAILAAPAEDVRAVGEEPVVFTCIGKGGRYEILGLATGAGLTRGEDRLVYRDISTSRLFLRTEADFSQRMEGIEK